MITLVEAISAYSYLRSSAGGRSVNTPGKTSTMGIWAVTRIHVLPERMWFPEGTVTYPTFEWLWVLLMLVSNLIWLSEHIEDY